MAGIGSVFAIGLVAQMLDIDEDKLSQISDWMDPEEGRLWVNGPDDQSTIAFTLHGIDCLRQLIADAANEK